MEEADAVSPSTAVGISILAAMVGVLGYIAYHAVKADNKDAWSPAETWIYAKYKRRDMNRVLAKLEAAEAEGYRK